jgi:hypothetical protein
VYLGHHVYRSKHGEIAQEVPAVIDRTLWDRAHTQLKRNLTRPKAKGRVDILRGLLKCKCGATFVCAALKRGVHYNRCSNQLPSSEPDPRCRCKAMYLRADDVEDHVWGNCLWILHDPDFITRSGRKPIEEYTEKHGNVEVERLRLNGELGINAVARNNVLELLRRGRLGLDDADAQLDILDKEASELRQAVEAADSVHECIQAYTASVQEMEQFLHDLRYDPTNPDDRRTVIEHMIDRVDVWTDGEGRHKTAAITVRWRVLPPMDAVGMPVVWIENSFGTTVPAVVIPLNGSATAVCAASIYPRSGAMGLGVIGAWANKARMPPGRAKPPPARAIRNNSRRDMPAFARMSIPLDKIARFGVPSSGHYGSLVRQPGRGPDLTKFAGDLAPGIAGVFADVHLPEQAEGEDSVGLGGVRRETPDG